MFLQGYHIVALISSIRAVMGTMVFVNPPNSGPVGDFSSNPTYTLGKNIEVSWSDSPDDAGVSLLMYQLNATTGDYFLPGQYLFREYIDHSKVGQASEHIQALLYTCHLQGGIENSYNVTTYDWIVAFSTETMPHAFSVSNLFYLSLYQEGKSSSDTNSHYFYIIEAQTSTTTTSSSTSTATSFSTAGASLAPTSANSAMTESTSGATTGSSGPAATASQPSNSDGTLGTGAKIGLGVGVSAVLILGVAVGWLLVRRRKARGQVNNAAEPDQRQWADGQYSGHTDAKGHDARYSAQMLDNTPPSGAVTAGQHNWPAFFEASGESRLHPVELDGNTS